LLQHFGSTADAGRRHYRAYVQACLTQDDRPLRDALRANRYAIGSPAHVKNVEDMLQRQRTGEPKDRDVSFPRPTVELDAIDHEVAAAFGLAPENLRKHGRRAGVAKAVAIELACRLTDLNQRQIGAHYGGITSMAVCMARRRFREDPAFGHAELQGRLDQLIAKLVDGK
jgi:hypothetical protein